MLVNNYSICILYLSSNVISNLHALRYDGTLTTGVGFTLVHELESSAG